MDATSMRCLLNSICRFIHLVSCQTGRPTLIQKDYKSMVVVLKHLKPVLDEVVDYKISSDEILCQECEKLDVAVNEGREFMENWCPKMSKIYSVLQSKNLFKKIQSISLEICHMLDKLLQSPSFTSGSNGVQNCMQELKCMKQETTTEHIEEALRSQQEDLVPCTDHVSKVIETLSLTTSQELLKESVAVEKQRMKAQVNNWKAELNQIDQIVDLISHIRNFLLKVQHTVAKTGISIPPYFRCPLSLELMLDPVIVASGQTYDRASIQNWLDHGLIICPRTRQTLTHTNLIPNYTVKAMISNWCVENNIRVPERSECTKPLCVAAQSDQKLLWSDSLHHSLQSSNSTPRSSLEVGNGFEKQKINVSSRLGGAECNEYQSNETENFELPSHELSYVHSRSESASSAISSIEYVTPPSNELPRVSTKNEIVNRLSGDIAFESPATPLLKKQARISPWLSGKQFHSPKTEAEVAGNENHSYGRNSCPSSDSGSDDLTTTSHVRKLVEDLKSQSNEMQTRAAAELRLLAKHNKENRIIIGHCGAIKPLLSLLYSEVERTQEHAVTALLNLSINEENKAMIAEAGVIESLIHVLKSGNDGAKENSAAALFSLSVLEEYKVKIGHSGAVKALADLLGSGTLRGKKDSATALFSLSIFHENRARIVQAGAVKYLVGLLDPATEMVDKAVALLANLCTIGEGCLAIGRAGGIPSLVEVVESGSQRGKENAAFILLQLCLHSPRFCTLVLQEGAVPPLVALSQSGTPRAKEKAQQLLSHFRSQREGSRGRENRKEKKFC